jgi:hypothetical protein
VSAQLTSSPLFPLPGATSPPTDVVTPPHHITLLFHGAKMSSLAPLHIPAIIRLIVSPLKLKLKH